MDGNEQAALDAAMTALAERILADSRLGAELQRARRDFHGEAASAPGHAPGAAAERRFLEWFALERESDMLGDVPAEVDRFGAAEALLGSTVGAFTVTGVSSDGAVARDLQDATMLELDVPPGSLAVGDLVVGRLFVIGTGRFRPSAAASVFRPGGSLAEAFARDVKRLELGRRLQQIELEHVLLRPQDEARAAEAAAAEPAAPLEHLEADLDRLLRSAAGARDGEREFSATAISERLAATARPGQVMGPLLEQIAFETAADLDAVRRVLLQIWNAHHAGDEPATAGDGAPGETLGERMVRALDDGLRGARDIDGLFAELEQMAGLEPGSADDGENPFDSPAEVGDEPGAGDLAPLVEEYLWETSTREADVAVTLRTWVQLQGNAAVPRNDLELVTGLDLMRVLLHVYLGAAPARRAAAVRAAFAALREFYAWAERTQQLDLAANLSACKGALLDDLDRLAAAGAELSTARGSGRRPAMFEVEEVGPRGFGVRDDDGGGHWVDARAQVAELLVAGDLVLGALADGAVFEGPVVVLPAEARALME